MPLPILAALVVTWTLLLFSALALCRAAQRSERSAWKAWRALESARDDRSDSEGGEGPGSGQRTEVRFSRSVDAPTHS